LKQKWLYLNLKSTLSSFCIKEAIKEMGWERVKPKQIFHENKIKNQISKSLKLNFIKTFFIPLILEFQNYGFDKGLMSHT
jgi:hypothetical protein